MPALITATIREQLLANGRRTARGEEIDPPPVVKLFMLDGPHTWLLTEIDPAEPTGRSTSATPSSAPPNSATSACSNSQLYAAASAYLSSAPPNSSLTARFRPTPRRQGLLGGSPRNRCPRDCNRLTKKARRGRNTGLLRIPIKLLPSQRLSCNADSAGSVSTQHSSVSSLPWPGGSVQNRTHTLLPELPPAPQGRQTSLPRRWLTQQFRAHHPQRRQLIQGVDAGILRDSLDSPDVAAVQPASTANASCVSPSATRSRRAFHPTAAKHSCTRATLREALSGV